MSDDRRTSRSGRTVALGLAALALLAGVIVLALSWMPREERRPSAGDPTATAIVSHDRTTAEALASSESNPVTREPAKPPRGAAPTRPERGSIRGQVVVVGAEARAPLDGFARVTAAVPAVAPFVPLPAVTVAGDGSFEFASVPFGDWVVTVELDAYAPARTRVLVEESRPNVHVELETVPAASHVLTVLCFGDDGSEIAPFEAVKSRKPSGLVPCFFEHMPVLGAKAPAGRLYPKLEQTSGEEPGAWVDAVFPFARAGFAAVELGGFVIDAAPFAAGQTRVVLKVDSTRLAAVHARLEVRVLDAATGAPLAGAKVRVGPEQPPYSGVFASRRPRHPLDLDSRTDERGVVEFTSASVGRVDLFVELTGYVAQARVLDLVPGPNPRCDLEFARGFTVRGSVQPPDAQGSVVCAALIESDGGARIVASTQRTTDGGFTLADLPAGEYAIGVTFAIGGGSIKGLADPVRAGKVPGYAYVDLRGGDVAEVVLVLKSPGAGR